MPKQDLKQPEPEPWQIALFVLLVIAFVGTALLNLIAGRTHYRSWWGGVVFTPYVLVAFLLLLVGLFRKKK